MGAGVVEVVGVYDADGGIVGELVYVVTSSAAPSAGCALTHDSTRRKPEWDAMVARLPVPVRLVHRNEASEPDRAAYHLSGLPAVLGVGSTGRGPSCWGLPGPHAVHGSVEGFESALRSALAAEGVGSPTCSPGSSSCCASRPTSATPHLSRLGDARSAVPPGTPPPPEARARGGARGVPAARDPRRGARPAGPASARSSRRCPPAGRPGRLALLNGRSRVRPVRLRSAQ